MAVAPAVSVIIPVYNGEKYIESVRESLGQQSFTDFEIIAIDDGSSDGSGSLLDSWSQEADNVTVYHTDNRGAAAARNLGVKKAKGEYIAFVDVDDTVTKDFIEYLYGLIRECADIAVGGYMRIYGDKALNYYDDADEICRQNGTDAMQQLLYQKQLMSVPWGYIAKKSLWEKVTFPENTRAEDMGTIYRLFYEANSVIIGKHVVYNYFQRLTNTMYSTSDKRNVDYFKHSRNMVRFVAANCRPYLEAAYSRHFSTCFQILSETAITNEDIMVRKIYGDIDLMQKVVIKDGNASARNRIAAVMSLFSVRVMHILVRGYYLVQKKFLMFRK